MSLIGEGTYGKVYRPPMRCNGRMPAKQKIVGKVFASPRDYADEVSISKKIEKINAAHEFSIPMIDTCADELQIIYRDGGMNLSDYMKRHKPTNFWKIFRQLRLVAIGIRQLSKRKLVHQDIKLENIVFDGTRIYLIDFGLMTNFSKVYQNMHFLRYRYMPFPPEYKRFAFGETFKKNFASFANADAAFASFARNAYPDFERDLDSLNEKPTYPRNKIDVYSLGMVLCEIYVWYGKRNEEVEALIRNMIRMDPRKRYNIDQVISFFEKIRSAVRTR